MSQHRLLHQLLSPHLRPSLLLSQNQHQHRLSPHLSQRQYRHPPLPPLLNRHRYLHQWTALRSSKPHSRLTWPNKRKFKARVPATTWVAEVFVEAEAASYRSAGLSTTIGRHL